MGRGEKFGDLSVRTCKAVYKDRKQIYLNCVKFQAKLFTLAMDCGSDITENGKLMVSIRGAGNAFQAHEGLDGSCSVRHTSAGELLFLKLHGRLILEMVWEKLTSVTTVSGRNTCL